MVGCLLGCTMLCSRTTFSASRVRSSLLRMAVLQTDMLAKWFSGLV
jgi:hypothetical protein